MAYDLMDLARVKHLLNFGNRVLDVTDGLDARIQVLENMSAAGIYYNTKAYWDEQPQLKSEQGKIYIYSDYASVNDVDVPNFKIGDGKAYLIDLPFSQDDLRAVVNAHISNSAIHLSTDDRKKLEDSISADVVSVGNNNFRLVLS